MHHQHRMNRRKSLDRFSRPGEHIYYVCSISDLFCSFIIICAIFSLKGFVHPKNNNLGFFLYLDCYESVFSKDSYTAKLICALHLVLDDGLYTEQRIVRARSLSKINSTVAPRQIYVDTSDEEDMFRYPVYQLPPRRRSRASSQENIQQGAPPVWSQIMALFTNIYVFQIELLGQG